MNIRASNDSEYSALLSIFNESRRAAGCFERADLILEDFLAQVAGEKIFVAEQNDSIVGFVSVWEEDRFIHHLYVSSQSQNAGIGRSLLDHCKKIYGLPLSLKCQVSNRSACSFYTRLGWVAKSSAVSVDGPYNHYWLEEI